MSLTLTPEGQEAQSLLDWVYDGGDIPSKAAQALEGLAFLAGSTDGEQAGREISDVGAQLRKLADGAAARTISDQVRDMDGQG